jgi:hypothetical protein
MAVDMKTGARLHRGNLMGSKIEKDPIVVTKVEGLNVAYTGTTGKLGSGSFTADNEGVAIRFSNGPQAVYVNEAEAKFGPTHGLGRRRKTHKSRRHQRKTRRSRK